MLGGHGCRRFVWEVSWTAAVVDCQEQAKGGLDWLEWNWTGISIESFKRWLHATSDIPSRQLVAMAAASIYPFWNQKFGGWTASLGRGRDRIQINVDDGWSSAPSCQICAVSYTCWANLTALKIANFFVVLNTASDLRLFGPLPLLQTMLLAPGVGYWRVSMSADAVKALFLDDAGNFKFPKLQNLSIELLDDRAAVELSNVMQGRKMKALRVPKSNLTDEGWATVHRLKKELGLATTSWDGPFAFVKMDSRTSVEVGHIRSSFAKKDTGFQGISPSWQALSFPLFCSAGWKTGHWNLELSNAHFMFMVARWRVKPSSRWRSSSAIWRFICGW